MKIIRINGKHITLDLGFFTCWFGWQPEMKAWRWGYTYSQDGKVVFRFNKPKGFEQSMMSFFEEQAQANPEAIETFIEETEKLTHEEIEHLRVLVTAGAPVFIRNKETGGWMGGQEFLKKLVQE